MSSDNLEIVKTVVMGVSALGTFLAVTVALFRDELRRCLFGLSIDFGSAEPFVVTDAAEGSLRQNIRIKVGNPHGVPVTGLAAIIEAVEVPGHTGPGGPITDLPLYLVPERAPITPPSFIAPHSHCFVTLGAFWFPPNGPGRPREFGLGEVLDQAIPVQEEADFNVVLHLALVSSSHRRQPRRLRISLDSGGKIAVLPA